MGARMKVAGLLVALGTVLGSAPTAAQTPIPPGTVLAGTLSFDGHASMGNFTGTTSSVSGEMSGGPTLASISGWVEAPVKTLVTGKGKRDADLNKSMESDKYPVIRYELDSVLPGAVSGDTTAVMLHGRFVIHGVTRDADLPGQVILSGGAAQVRAGTPLNLKDYRIGGLSKMLGVLKMNEHIEVHVDVTFGLAAAPAAPAESVPAQAAAE